MRDPAAAERVVEDYRSLSAALPPPPIDAWLSVDPTHLALDADPSGAVDRLAAIATALAEGQRVQVGAEDAARTDAVLGCVLDVAGRGLADRLGATVQANLLRSPGDADALAAAGVHVRTMRMLLPSPSHHLELQVEFQARRRGQRRSDGSRGMGGRVPGLQPRVKAGAGGVRVSRDG